MSTEKKADMEHRQKPALRAMKQGINAQTGGTCEALKLKNQEVNQ
jgi:hypothetical protein